MGGKKNLCFFSCNLFEIPMPTADALPKDLWKIKWINCQKCGLCTQICPQGFSQEQSGQIRVINPEARNFIDAVKICPNQAIIQKKKGITRNK